MTPVRFYITDRERVSFDRQDEVFDDLEIMARTVSPSPPLSLTVASATKRPDPRWNHLGGNRYCAGDHPKHHSCEEHAFEWTAPETQGRLESEGVGGVDTAGPAWPLCVDCVTDREHRGARTVRGGNGTCAKCDAGGLMYSPARSDGEQAEPTYDPCAAQTVGGGP